MNQVTGQDLCDRLTEVTELPFANEPVQNEVYNGLMKLGDAAIPCLMAKLTDATVMPDPRKAPPYPGLTVGDVAHFILVDLTRMPFEEMLPGEIKKDYSKDGVYAYFKFVKEIQNRKLLQSSWQAWYEHKSGRKAH